MGGWEVGGGRPLQIVNAAPTWADLLPERESVCVVVHMYVYVIA